MYYTHIHIKEKYYFDKRKGLWNTYKSKQPRLRIIESLPARLTLRYYKCILVIIEFWKDEFSHIYLLASVERLIQPTQENPWSFRLRIPPNTHCSNPSRDITQSISGEDCWLIPFSISSSTSSTALRDDAFDTHKHTHTYTKLKVCSFLKDIIFFFFPSSKSPKFNSFGIGIAKMKKKNEME